jgi:hypothetical protein
MYDKSMTMPGMKPDLKPGNEIEFPFVITRGSVNVTIYRVKSATNAGGWYYQVADYHQRKDAAGKPKRTLVSFADFDDAKQEAKRIAQLLVEGETHALEMRGAERASYACAVQTLEPTGTSLELAATRYAAAVKILGDGSKLEEAARFYVARHPVLSKTVPQLIDELIAVKTARKKSDRYLQDLRHRLGRFAESFPVNISEVDTGRLQSWLDGLGLSE